MESGRIISKTAKRRLRRERLMMEKKGEFIPFTPSSETPSAEPTTENLPKMTKSAKRAARKRKKLNVWQQEINSICSEPDTGSPRPTVVLKDQKEKGNLPSPKKRKNKRSSTATPKHTEDLKEQKEQEYLPSPKKPKMDVSDKTDEDNEIPLSSDKNSLSTNTAIECHDVKGGIGNEDNDELKSNVNDCFTEEVIDKPEEAAKVPKQDLIPKKRRYVLFVGNLSYEIQEEDIMDHFKKVGPIVSVRMAKHKDTNASRGFCHLEVGDEETYLKALSLHHSFMHKRRINVEYSSGQSGEKGDAKRKSFKLHTLTKTGQLGGSTVQKNGHAKKLRNKSVQKNRGEFFV